MRARWIASVTTIVTFMLGAPAWAETHEVLVSSFQFSPSELTINEGDTVEWTLVSGTHDVVSGTGCTEGPSGGESFNSGILGGGGFQYTFNSAATVGYFCSVGSHCSGLGMEGTINVASAGSGQSAPSMSLLGFALVGLLAGGAGLRFVRLRS